MTKEYLIVHDYQHGSVSYRVQAQSREEIISEIGNDFEIWENFRDDKLLSARFRMRKNNRCWEDIPMQPLAELGRMFGNWTNADKQPNKDRY